MAELFLVGTLPFWGLILAEIVLLFIFVAYENGIGATLSLVAFGLILQFFGGVNIANYIVEHPIQLGIYVLLYFFIGTIWGIVKWWLLVWDRRAEYDEFKTEWLRLRDIVGSKNIPVNLKAEWQRTIKNQEWSTAPLARDHKAKIIGWMALWVPSMLYSLFNDAIRRIFLAIYYRIARELQKISDKIYSNIKDDMPATGGDN